MSENVPENEHENVSEINALRDSSEGLGEISDNDEPLLKSVKPIFKPGRPRKTDEEKAQTRRAMLDRRNERNRERTQAAKTKQVEPRPEPKQQTSDPLFNDKMEMEKRLLQKKFMIEDKKLDIYLQQLNTPQAEVKPKKPRAPRKPKLPQIVVPTGPKEKTPEEKANDIFRMYN